MTLSRLQLGDLVRVIRQDGRPERNTGIIIHQSHDLHTVLFSVDFFFELPTSALMLVERPNPDDLKTKFNIVMQTRSFGPKARQMALISGLEKVERLILTQLRRT